MSVLTLLSGGGLAVNQALADPCDPDYGCAEEFAPIDSEDPAGGEGTDPGGELTDEADNTTTDPTNATPETTPDTTADDLSDVEGTSPEPAAEESTEEDARKDSGKDSGGTTEEGAEGTTAVGAGGIAEEDAGQATDEASEGEAAEGEAAEGEAAEGEAAGEPEEDAGETTQRKPRELPIERPKKEPTEPLGSEQTTQSPPDPTQANEEFHLAVNTALDKLKRFPHCNEFVTGLDSPKGESALTILDKVWHAGRIHDLYSKHGTPAPDGRLPYAESTTGMGSAGTIKLYQEWHQSKPTPASYNNDDGGRPLSQNEWRTLVLLHELAHLTNAMPSHRTPAGNAKNTYLLNQGILLTCLRGR